jgi:hypothetical protein
MFSMQDRIKGFDDALWTAIHVEDHIGDAVTTERVRRDAEALCARFPVCGSTAASGPQRRATATA